MTQSRASFFFLAFAVGLACAEPTGELVAGGEALVGFRLAFEEPGDCQEASGEFHTVTPFGEPKSLFAPPAPAFSVPHEAVLAARTWTRSGSPPTLTLLLEEGVARELSEWVGENAPKIGDWVLVTLDDSAIGSMRGPALSSMSGLLVLSLTKEKLAAVRKTMNVTTIPESAVTAHNGASICEVLAEGDESLLQRCRDLLTEDFAKQNEVLDRVEEQLDSENPDYDAILRDLGVE